MNKDIAIIGISGRFPLADDLDELFENLKEGVDCVVDISAERIMQTTLPPDRPYRKCGYLKDIDKFDHKFFGISLAEAKAMSPDQRLLLETVHNVLENAGYSPESLSGTNTAVFVSTITPEYPDHASEFMTTLVTGNSPEFLAAKIGRYFNFRGNVAVVDTTCSSTLVAVHIACNELIVGDADMAVVAGANLLLFPFLDDVGGLDTESPDGKSRAFSARANGMSYGEVVGAVLLKPLEKALVDKDNIQAVIKGTAVNYNGNDSVSITAPDSRAQADVLVRAWKKAGIKATELSYIEAHGSGTQLGDSLEFEALNLAFSEYTNDKQLCPISTIKSNVGHGRNVSGLAGLLKTVLSLKRKVLFPTIHFDKPSPLLDFNNSAVYVNTGFRPWELNGHKARYAGVTSLGASGTNCHIVLQEAPFTLYHGSPEISTIHRFHIPVSGKSMAALHRNAAALLSYIERNSALNIADISYTLTAGRDHYDHRLSYVVSSVAELIQALRRDVHDHPTGDCTDAEKLIFILSESNELPEGVIAELRQNHRIFDDTWRACETHGRLDNIQARDFTFQYSLYFLLEAANIRTDHILPLGLGAIVQQVIDKQLSLGEGLKAASAYVAQEINNKEERVKKLIGRAEKESVTFMDIAFKGTLYQYLKEYDQMNGNICFIGQDGSNNPLLGIIHTLYLRKYQRPFNHAIAHGLVGKRIELPAYQFEKSRCWIRETPKETLTGNPERKKYLLKEEAGNIERRLAEIFSVILHRDEISLYDDFFELGGDSLKATWVINEANRYFKTSLNFEDIFDFPQIHQLATYISRQLSTAFKIAIVWEEVLQYKGLTPEDDFFSLGGHSLMATQIIVLLNKEFGVALNFEDIFRNPTISALSAYVDSLLSTPARTISRNSIPPAAPQESFRLTYAQKRMWFLSQFVGANSAYNNVFGIYLDGYLDYETFDRAILSILGRHESLRTVFRIVNDEPRQFILGIEEISFRSRVTDAVGVNDPTALISGIFADEDIHIFDLSAFPLLRIRLIRVAPDRHVCILNIHHIISDGWSIGVFLEDFNHFHEAATRHEPDGLEPLQVQIKDYAEWQHQPEYEQTLKAQEAYWLNQFSDSIPVLSLPMNDARPVIQSFAGDRVHFGIDRHQTDALKKIAHDHGGTLYMVLLSVYSILLGKLSNSEDVVVGTPVAGRRLDGLQSLIGLFVNTIVLRCFPRHGVSFTEFLTTVKKISLEAFNNQDYPYEELVKKLLIERDTSRNPLFDTMLVFQNNRDYRKDFGSLKAAPYPASSKTSRFDLLLEATEVDQALTFTFEYATALFRKETIKELITYFRKIIVAVTADAGVMIGDIEIITEREKDRILNHFNDTGVPYPENGTILSLFEERVKKYPDNVALVYHDIKLSYREVKAQSDAVASYLQHVMNVNRGDLVGLMLERDENMIPAIYGILKAGGVYVPIDPNYPADRINSIIDNSKLKLIVTRGRYLTTGISIGSLLDLDSAWPAINAKLHGPVVITSQGHDLAYVIYTSGSTGKPKGVMVEHRSLCNVIQCLHERYPLLGHDNYLLKTNCTFDVSIAEIFGWFMDGGSLSVLAPGLEGDPAGITEAIQKHGITHINFVPSMFSVFVDELENTGIGKIGSLKYIFLAGEALSKDLVARFRMLQPAVALENIYGPTESTIYSCGYAIKDLTNKPRIPIGKPLGNIRLYIVDQSQHLQPIGIAGELCIGGVALARGYLGNEKLTDEKFVSNPHLSGERLYRTGDLARWLPDGNVEFLGRIDNQVKIRGYRIELDEIEGQLTAHNSVREAVVTVKEKAQDRYLVAYYVSEAPVGMIELKAHLSARLPHYMVPAYFVHLRQLPLTHSGKVDRRALPDPHVNASEDRIAPAGAVEKKLAEIWANILHIGKESIGVHDDFFALGGHSIMAVKLIHTLQQEFSADITLRQVFEFSSVARQAELMRGSQVVHHNEITRVEDRQFYPASSAQERLYYEQMASPESLAYNIPSVYQIRPALDISKLRRAFRQLHERHDSLRTCFQLSGDSLAQSVEARVDFEIPVLEANGYRSVKEAFDTFIKPFDLARPSLMRCAVLQHEQWGIFLFVDIHHIVCDGISLNILMNDFKNIYEGKTLKPLELRYVDYACWQKGSGSSLTKQREFWRKQLSEDIHRIDLPIIQDRDAVEFYYASRKVFEIKGALYEKVKKFAVESNVSDFMFLLSLYYILLSRMSDNSDIIVGTDAIGRVQKGLKNIVGTFVNVLPLRLQVPADIPYKEFLTRVKNCVLEAFDNQEYQFDQMVSLLNRREKIIDVHFSFANYFDNETEIMESDFVALDLSDQEATTQYEFKLEVHAVNHRFEVRFIYCNELYDDDTIELFMGYYRNILMAVLDNQSLDIGLIELTRSEEVMEQ